VIVLPVVAFQIATYTLPTVELPLYVSEESDIVWYPVFGSTIRELQAQMRASGPKDGSGVYAGYTRNDTYWHINWREHTGTCAVTDVSVTAYDTVTLPVWSPPPTTDPAVVAEWSRFVTMLGRHEEGHREIAIAGAGQIARALASLSPQAVCADLATAANGQGRSILASTHVRQQQYDADTQHGERRGTNLENLSPAPRRLPPLVVVPIVMIVAAIVWRAYKR
jgi:predicted secreted Zn-dependent protease